MKNSIIFTIVGILIAIVGFQAWFIYSINKQVVLQGQAITQIVTFINQSIAQQTPAVNPTK